MNLAKYRKEKKYTQLELANLIGVTRSAVSMWELNLSNPNIKKLQKIAKVLNCTVDDLINDTSKNEKE